MLTAAASIATQIGLWFILSNGSGYIAPIEFDVTAICGKPGAVAAGIQVDKLENPSRASWTDLTQPTTHCEVDIANKVTSLQQGQYHIASTVVGVDFVGPDPHLSPYWMKTGTGAPPPPSPTPLPGEVTMTLTLQATTGVLMWDRNTEPDVLGYRVAYGSQPGMHNVVVDVGNVVTYQMTRPSTGAFYIVVRAYNASGTSEDSNEVMLPAIVAPPPPPQPTPCVFTEALTNTVLGACVAGSQTRTETWTRTIVTQPTNGGTACPALTDTRVTTQACTVVPPPQPPPTSPNNSMAPPLTSLVDASGAVWTLGTNKATLRNGIHVGGGFGSKLLWYNGVIYVFNSDLASWFRWSTGWTNIGRQQPGTTPDPPPPPTPDPTIEALKKQVADLQAELARVNQALIASQTAVATAQEALVAAQAAVADGQAKLSAQITISTGYASRISAKNTILKDMETHFLQLSRKSYAAWMLDGVQQALAK